MKARRKRILVAYSLILVQPRRLSNTWGGVESSPISEKQLIATRAGDKLTLRKTLSRFSRIFFQPQN